MYATEYKRYSGKHCVWIFGRNFQFLEFRKFSENLHCYIQHQPNTGPMLVDSTAASDLSGGGGGVAWILGFLAVCLSVCLSDSPLASLPMLTIIRSVSQSVNEELGCNLNWLISLLIYLFNSCRKWLFIHSFVHYLVEKEIWRRFVVQEYLRSFSYFTVWQ